MTDSRCSQGLSPFLRTVGSVRSVATNVDSPGKLGRETRGVRRYKKTECVPVLEEGGSPRLLPIEVIDAIELLDVADLALRGMFASDTRPISRFAVKNWGVSPFSVTSGAGGAASRSASGTRTARISGTSSSARAIKVGVLGAEAPSDTCYLFTVICYLKKRCAVFFTAAARLPSGARRGCVRWCRGRPCGVRHGCGELRSGLRRARGSGRRRRHPR